MRLVYRLTGRSLSVAMLGTAIGGIASIGRVIFGRRRRPKVGRVVLSTCHKVSRGFGQLGRELTMMGWSAACPPAASPPAASTKIPIVLHLVNGCLSKRAKLTNQKRYHVFESNIFGVSDQNRGTAEGRVDQPLSRMSHRYGMTPFAAAGTATYTGTIRI